MQKRWLAFLMVGTVAMAACSSDEATTGNTSSTIEEEAPAPVDPLVTEALASYTDYVAEEAASSLAGAQQLQEAVASGDLEAAKAAYAPSRQGWERIEPIAGLVEEIDGTVDARVDDFEGEDDPTFTGWHRIEYLLWTTGDTAAAVPFADQLVADLETLVSELETLEIPPAALAVGASELIEEVSTGKITGEEDRYSGTDLWDFAANVEGSEKAIELLTPALEAADPELLAEVEAGFAQIDEELAPYADGEGWQPYSALTESDKTKMQTTLAELSESLSQVAGALGLES